MASNKVDMLSCLTDPLLFIIISFLPFKEAARTSILSKRWRHIWRATKNIQLEESFFVKHHEESTEIKVNQRNLFLNFAKSWIQNYSEPTAHKFRLIFSNPNNNHLLDIQNLIHFAITHKVKFLELDFSDPMWKEESLDNRESVFELPMFVYEHADLEAIKLFSCKFKVPEFGNFRTLRSISLGWIQLTTSSFAALLTNCVSLEDLCLKKCMDLGQLDIYAHNLRTLVIDKCLSLEGGVRIYAQKLRVFKYSGPLIAFELLDLDSLVEVDLDFGLEYEFNEYGDILYRLLGEMYRVRVLSVCSYTLQVIPTGEEPLSLQPPLNDVQHLTLKTALNIKEYYGISFFLNSCQRVEKLSIILDAPARIFDDNSWLEDQGEHQFLGRSSVPYIVVYGCMQRSLKVVEVKGFKGGVNELLVLQYLIMYGSVLERLYIGISNEKGANGEDMGLLYRQNFMKLFSMKRASPNLLILIR